MRRFLTGADDEFKELSFAEDVVNVILGDHAEGNAHSLARQNPNIIAEAIVKFPERLHEITPSSKALFLLDFIQRQITSDPELESLLKEYFMPAAFSESQDENLLLYLCQDDATRTSLWSLKFVLALNPKAAQLRLGDQNLLPLHEFILSQKGVKQAVQR